MTDTSPMKDQVWQQLIEHLKSTKDFILEQAPDVIQQALKYERVAAFISAAVSAIILIICLGVAYFFWKYPILDRHGSREILSFLGVFLPLVIAVPLSAQLYNSIDTLVKIFIAPKYFLIQLLMDLK